MNETKTVDLATELQDALRSWAHAQSPQTDFASWRMATFNEPVRLRNGLIFSAGEVVLCRPAPEKAGDFAERVGLPPPLAVWSFEMGGEILASRNLVSYETEMERVEPEPKVIAA